jgi:hypothetical protein
VASAEHINHIHIFGFAPFQYPSLVQDPLSVLPMSNNITAFVLRLQSANKGEHVIFDLLSLANFA